MISAIKLKSSSEYPYPTLDRYYNGEKTESEPLQLSFSLQDLIEQPIMCVYTMTSGSY